MLFSLALKAVRLLLEFSEYCRVLIVLMIKKNFVVIYVQKLKFRSTGLVLQYFRLKIDSLYSITDVSVMLLNDFCHEIQYVYFIHQY